MAVLCCALCACTRYSPAGTQLPTMDSAPLEVTRNASDFATVNSVDSGYLMPDGDGGHFWMPGAPRGALNPETVAANELRLKVRELAEQLFGLRSNEALGGLIAMPTSFVNLNDFDESMPLGRYMAEALYYECNQRGFPVREYRLNGKIRMEEGAGEFALTRSLPPLSYKQSWAAVIVGTYLKDPSGIFINVRMIKPDGLVLRTAQLFLPSNPMIARLSTNPPKPPLTAGNMRIKARSSR